MVKNINALCFFASALPSGYGLATVAAYTGIRRLPMLRQRFSDALKGAMKEKDALSVSTVRLIIAKLKEQDIDARGKGKPEIGDAEIQQMMQGMIKQRRDSVALYEQGNRPELAEKER